MPNLANIALADGKATPVTHTFSPVTTDGAEARLANRSGSFPQGQETLVVTMRDVGNSKTAAYRILGTLILPTVGTVNGVDTVIRTSQFKFEFDCSQLSTAAERKDLRVLAANLLQNSLMTTVIENLEPIY